MAVTRLNFEGRLVLSLIRNNPGIEESKALRTLGTTQRAILHALLTNGLVWREKSPHGSFLFASVPQGGIRIPGRPLTRYQRLMDP